ncbi:MAG TPA: hemerythrin domain-containing protein [Rhizomicrobium sp.]|jgi:hemerythrin superfamily protein|nr:hemerythrin domain-containing protein [Rhizomicrobium sp.]
MTARTKSKAKPKDAIALLKADHRKVEGLFADYKKARTSDRKRTLAQQICLELTVHTKIEEDVFYPACREDGVDEDLMDEAYVEHDGAKVLVREIETGDPDDDYYDAKVKVLSEMIKHHVKEEEKKQGNMFAKAKKAGVDVTALGERMAEEKQNLAAQYEEKGLPKPPTPTFTATQFI